MTGKLQVLTSKSRGEGARAFQSALNRRLLARDMDQYVVKEDGVMGPRTFSSARKGAWILGAMPETYESIVSRKQITVGVQRMVRNPGTRTEAQLGRAQARLRYYRKHREKMSESVKGLSSERLRFVGLALRAAKNYEANPSAYHYLAGGVANLIFLEPSPITYRSDCSQFASSVQNAAGLPDLGRNGPLWVNTWTMDEVLKQTKSPKPGDFGMYGPPGNPHHVELYCALPGYEFIGHGSQPIDSVTPGRPTYYLENPAQ